MNFIFPLVYDFFKFINIHLYLNINLICKNSENRPENSNLSESQKPGQGNSKLILTEMGKTLIHKFDKVLNPEIVSKRDGKEKYKKQQSVEDQVPSASKPKKPRLTLTSSLFESVNCKFIQRKI
jgi:hypothetical protein